MYEGNSAPGCDPALKARVAAMIELQCLLDQQMIVLDANAVVLGVTDNFMKASCSPSVAIDGERLVFKPISFAQRFNRSFRVVLDADVGWRTIARLDDNSFATLIRYSIQSQPVIVMLLAERSPSRRVCPACLMRLFDLTSREVDLVLQLVTGRRIHEAAVMLEISVGTARTHLRHVFQKTQVESQSALVTLIASLSFGCCPQGKQHCCTAADTNVIPEASVSTVRRSPSPSD